MVTDTKTKEMFLDVRPSDVYDGGHIPGAVNIPLDTLDAFVRQLPGKDAPIYVYCQDGIRSAKGAKLLRNLGYTNVTDYGPITHWNGDLEKS